MTRVLLLILSFLSVGVSAHALSLQDRSDLQSVVLAHASRRTVAGNRALMKCMIRLYRTETYDQLRTLTNKLKNTLDKSGSQTHDDVDLVTSLDLMNGRNVGRRYTL